MAEGDAEKKNISRLDFNISDAINSLDLVDKKLKDIAESSSKYGTTISKNLNKGLNTNQLVDTSKIEKNLNTATNLSKTKAEQLSVQLAKIEAKKQANIQTIVAKGEQDRQSMAYKTALKQEEYNQRVLKSTENLYDKITQYAKTYVIYQGFNALKKGIQETIDEMVEVEQKMVAIDRVLNESNLNITQYRDQLIQLSYDYGNTFNNVADITLRLAQAGFDSQESLALTEKTLLALNTAELNATQATDDMVAVMAQWGLMTGDAKKEADDYAAIIDKINKVADNFPTTSADLMNALKKVSSAFNLAGASIDETIATIVAAEKASQRGGKVIGTALSNIVQQIKAEGKLNLAEEMGLDFYADEAKTQFKPIMEIFEEMANRMQELKDSGKESSVEMQNLLELFTVFRRNIGASLLGEMSGEDSTYLKALETSINSVGYSLQENEKYMRTAKAAQAQFNAELLKLKTEVWDNQLEAVFRDMLSAGKDLVAGLTNLIDKFGALPTTIGVAVGAFTALNKKVQAFTYDSKTSSIQLNGFFKSVADGTKSIRETNKAITMMKDGQMALNAVQGSSAKAFIKNTGEVVKYGASLVASTVKTIALQVATVALNAAISMGLSLAITAIIAGIDNWIHKTERMIEANTELMQSSQENANKINQERKNLEDLTTQLDTTIKKYKELDESDEDKTEITTKLYELQTQINEALEGTGEKVNLINESLDNQGNKVISINNEWERQIKILDQISYKKKVEEIKELEAAMDAANAKLVGTQISPFDDFRNTKLKQLEKAGVKLTGYEGNEFLSDVYDATGGKKGSSRLSNVNTDKSSNPLPYIEDLDIDTQVKYLNQWIDALEIAKNRGDDVNESLTYFRGKLKEIETQQQDVTSTTEKYNSALKELYGDTYSLQGYQVALQGIMNTYKDDEGVKNLISVLGQLNKDFSEGKITSEEYFNGLNSQIKNIKNTVAEDGGEISQGMQAIFAETTRYIAQALESAIIEYDEGTSTFYAYQDALSQSADSLLELYAAQNNLHLDEQNQKWVDANNNINEYANSLQNASDTVASFSDMLRGLGESYDYIAEHADAAGQANFQLEDVSSQAYQSLAENFSNSLAQMRTVNSEAWTNITKNVFDSSGVIATEVANVDDYVANALATNNGNLNAALNEASRQAQDATNNLGTATGQLLENLGKAIDNFDYTINFDTTGEITPGGNLLNIATGVPFKPTSTLALKIRGSGGTNISGLAASLQDFGKSFNEYITSNSGYKSLLQTIKPYTPSSSGFTGNTGSTTPTSSTPRSSGGGSSGGSGSSGRSSSTSSSETKAEEDEYKKRLEMFKAYITEKERLEKRWVDKQKDLGLLSNNDFLYITQQRIERYKDYIKAVEEADWMHEEDKLELTKTYNEKIEDLQLDYFGYLQNKLKEDIEALKKSNTEKINLVKEEATQRINALKAVEKENDRIRAKEEYEKKRASHLEDISYWEQRTGREAQEALKEARKNLKELDEQWEEQMEDWSIEDQIKAIEEERDTQIQAIEDAQQAEIDSMQAVYDAKVKMFAETGKIIYEGSVIQSQALYNQYKNNFIDPIIADLERLNKEASASATVSTASNVTETASAPAQEYETYTIQWGDTLTKIANQFGTTIEKIMEANPYVTNKNRIYAGRTLEIPKFHEGGIVGGNKEGYALLKPDEVILKPEWADGINKLAQMAKNRENPINTTNTVIEVSGDLVRIDANIKDRTDAEYLTKRVEKMLKDKFNIKK